MKSLRIVFMGTPEFAVPMLTALLQSSHRVVAVVTAPDKPAGRGMKLVQSEVKQLAEAKGIRVLQPEKLRAPQFLDDLQQLQADLFVVVAFRMLPEVVWGMPPLGTINLHASLLPQYRGAAPINRAIMNGETETGVTTFFIQQEIDTGKIIYARKVTIGEEETAGELYRRLMDAGTDVLRQTVDAIAAGDYPQTPQTQSVELKTAPKLFKEDCRILWNKSVRQVYNQIRGLSPYPAAFTELNGKIFKLFKATKHLASTGEVPGTVKTDGSNYLHFYCADGYISVVECQLEGKKKMPVAEFLRGNKITSLS